ncbi:MAG: L,D-transpeptidase family protein [Candidatus Omnitrophota bacterium]|nr:L,D-transpeptidase family protein [Candidatus Omnitrophota bacterium]
MNQRWIIAIVAVVFLAGIGLVVVGKYKPGGENRSSGASTASVGQMLGQAAQYEAEGDPLKAKDLYAQVVSDHPDYDKIEEVQDRLGALSIVLITSNTPTPQTVLHEIVPGDSLGKLARQYNTTMELIKKSNNLKSDVIRVGQKLRVWTAPFTVLVDKSRNILILKTAEEVVKVYHVSTGAGNSTPIGHFKIAAKLVDPVWFKAGSKPIPPESPENELGSRWMGFAENPQYGIHGTIKPNLIGQQATAGCVRLVNHDVEELFDLLPPGTQVTIQD